MLTEMESVSNYENCDCDIKYAFVRVPESCLKLGWRTGCQPRFLFLRRYLCVNTVIKILSEISRFRIVQLKMLTEMESAFNYKDCDINYVLVGVSEIV